METKQIQEERMRRYFIDSAKNLIRGEGLKSISVRNVAHHAGYSYATLYNYFKDVNDLLYHCVDDFCREAEEFIAGKTGTKEGIEGVKATVRAYIAYFTEYPGVYELFFIEKMGNFGDKPRTATLITGLLDRLTAPHWERAVALGELTGERAMKYRWQLRYMLPGMLLFYENRMYPSNYAEFMAQVEKVVNDIMKG